MLEKAWFSFKLWLQIKSHILSETMQTRLLITLNGNYTKRQKKIEKMLKLIEIVCLVKIVYITQTIIWFFECYFSSNFLIPRQSLQLSSSVCLDRWDNIQAKIWTYRKWNEHGLYVRTLQLPGETFANFI